MSHALHQRKRPQRGNAARWKYCACNGRARRISPRAALRKGLILSADAAFGRRGCSSSPVRPGAPCVPVPVEVAVQMLVRKRARRPGRQPPERRHHKLRLTHSRT